ncbi:MAG TPA: hypothetical protein VME22_25900 [Solirubrobacteraceae bacterium]|nr:hypothetical protein [Solirubrobacteraceae bacterium]
MAHAQACAGGGAGSGQGLQVWSIASTQGANGAGWWFQAPAGTSIVGLSANGYYSALDGWVSHWATNGDGSGDPGEPDCDTSGCDNQSGLTYVGVNHASEIGFAIWCDASSCKANDSLSWFGPAGSANVGQADVVVDEPSAPSFPTLYGSLVNHSGWISANAPPAGGWYVTYNASDPAGICVLQTLIVNAGGGLEQEDPQNANPDYTQAAPCPARPGYTWQPNIAALPDGYYYLHVQATNPAGMESDATGANGIQLAVDNTPPTIGVISGPSSTRWYNAPQTVTWAAQDNLSGVQGLSCTDAWHPGVSSYTMTVSQQGTHVVGCNAEDNAGNWGQNGGASATVNLDLQTPSVSFTGPSQTAWLRGPQTVTVTGSEQQPLSGIDGLSCSMNGGSATWTAATQATVTATADGTNTIQCRALTNAGTWSGTETYTLHLDSEPPTLSYANGPSQGRWYASAQSIEVVGQSQPGLAPIASISCTINGQTTVYQGSQVQVTVPPPGGQLACAAEDQAGNWSQSQAWNFLIDNTPPTGYFDPPDPSNPDQVTATVGDTQSGVAGGQIQIQVGGVWQDVNTSYDPSSGQLSAQMPDDGSVADGNYSVRAVVWDAVGNQGIVTSSVAGARESVTLPLRIVTQVHAGPAAALVRRCAVRHARLRQATQPNQYQAVPARVERHCSTVAVPEARVPLGLGHGQNATVQLLLETADGEPVAHAWLEVTAQAPGWTAQQAGVVRTGSDGRLRYNIAPGPSRTITFSFPGTDTMRAASASMSVQVAGRATITASKVAVAGQKLRLSGRVLGGYIPPGGTLIQLQYRVAGYPEGWAPFDVLVRSRRNGFWSTTVTLPPNAANFTYEIRAVVSAQTGWPWTGAVTNVITRRVAG